MAKRSMTMKIAKTAPARIWEVWHFSIYMPVGTSGGYEWVDFTLTCEAGHFLKDFRTLNIPGFPEFDVESASMRRERVYRGAACPAKLATS